MDYKSHVLTLPKRWTHEPCSSVFVSSHREPKDTRQSMKSMDAPLLLALYSYPLISSKRDQSVRVQIQHRRRQMLHVPDPLVSTRLALQVFQQSCKPNKLDPATAVRTMIHNLLMSLGVEVLMQVGRRGEDVAAQVAAPPL